MSCFISFMFSMFFFSSFCSRIHVDAGMNSSVPAIYVFGDSTVDPGNNNYIATIMKSDFSPYGVDFPSHQPTGRFCNGKLTTDFIASYLRIKDSVPPYLDNTLSVQELTTGVSFASAGSGYDAFTGQVPHSPYSAIPMSKQLEYFQEYKTKMEQTMGKPNMEAHISNSGYVISAGTNDFVVTYYTALERRAHYNVGDYVNFLLQNTQNFIQGLIDLGARKIGVVGLPPMGCLPFVITFQSAHAYMKNGCVDSFNLVAQEYNQKLKSELQSIMKLNTGVKIAYCDIFQPLLDIIQNYGQKGFLQANTGCCGTGKAELGYLCNRYTPVCPDRSKYVFFDSIHPTEKTYELLFESFRPLIDSLLK